MKRAANRPPKRRSGYVVDSEFRPCVLAVFTNDRGQVLVAERATLKGAWQFPQGGIEPGESPAVAVVREMKEELGLEAHEIEILRQAAKSVRYVWPPGFEGAYSKRFKGQDQIWFLLRLRGEARPDLALATDKEFVSTDWVSPKEALERIIGFKRDAYVAGLNELGVRVDESK